jgi:hypothetical protein
VAVDFFFAENSKSASNRDNVSSLCEASAIASREGKGNAKATALAPALSTAS